MILCRSDTPISLYVPDVIGTSKNEIMKQNLILVTLISGVVQFTLTKVGGFVQAALIARNRLVFN